VGSRAQAEAAWYGLARLYLLQGNYTTARIAQKIVEYGQATRLGSECQSRAEKKLGEAFV